MSIYTDWKHVDNKRLIRYFILLILNLFFSVRAGDFVKLLPASLDWQTLDQYKTGQKPLIVKYSGSDGVERSFLNSQLYTWQNQDNILHVENYQNPGIEKFKKNIESSKDESQIAQYKKRLDTIEKTVLKKINYDPNGLQSTKKLFTITDFSSTIGMDSEELKELIKVQLLVTSYVPADIIMDAIKKKNNLSDYHYYIVSLATFLNWLKYNQYLKKDFNNDYLPILKKILRRYIKNKNLYTDNYMSIILNKESLKDYILYKARELVNIIPSITTSNIIEFITNIIDTEMKKIKKTIIVPEEINFPGNQLGNVPQPQIIIDGDGDGEGNDDNPVPQPENYPWYHYKNFDKKIRNNSKKSFGVVVLLLGVVWGYFNQEKLKIMFPGLFSEPQSKK